MYTAGLAPFYASNFSLWSAAYCTPAGPGNGGCFPLDPAGLKKPSFCIADILHAAAGEAAVDGLPGGPSANLAAHLGAVHAHAQFHAAASPLRPTPMVAPDTAVTFPARLSPLSATYHPHAQHHRSPTGISSGPQNQQTHPGSAPAPSSKDLKFGIDRILSAEFDPKLKESNTLRGRESRAGLWEARELKRATPVFVVAILGKCVRVCVCVCDVSLSTTERVPSFSADRAIHQSVYLLLPCIPRMMIDGSRPLKQS